MSEKGTITVESVLETGYGEKAVLESPYEAKNWIKVLPWGDEGEPSLDSIDPDDEDYDEVVEAAKAFDFPDDLTAHSTYHGDSQSWRIDEDSVDTAIEFWKENGWEVKKAAVVQNR